MDRTKRHSVAKAIEGQDIHFADGTLRIVSVLETSERFCTVLAQRVNKSGLVDKRDMDNPRRRTFAWGAVQ